MHTSGAGGLASVSGKSPKSGSRQRNFPSRQTSVDAGRFQVGQLDAVRHRLLGIDHDQRVDAAAGPGTGQADEPAGRVGAEVHREMSDHQQAKRLGHLPGLGVVLGQGLVAIAQELLQHRLHVRGHVGQALVDVGRFRPDSAVDERFILVGQVHEGGEILAPADGIDDRAAQLARRQTGPGPQQQRFQRLHAGIAAPFHRLEQDGRFSPETAAGAGKDRADQTQHRQLRDLRARCEE